MTRVKILALALGMVLLLTLPSVASAQRVPPHVFVGEATLDGAAAADGTTVTAIVAGADAATATVTGGDGSYTIVVDQEDSSFGGETVSFTIDGNAADETSSWEQGGGTELNLTASSGPAPTEVPADTPVPAATAAPVQGEPGPRDCRGSGATKDSPAIPEPSGLPALPASQAQQVLPDLPVPTVLKEPLAPLAPLAPMALPAEKGIGATVASQANPAAVALPSSL